ncbi:MAG: PIN domain-containing protein [Verrucomicrobia bacterium]|jgi:predicted nucleic acid-binding protein|nr:PIN domain-containing protein [Verrucomicrobiota bacterium]
MREAIGDTGAIVALLDRSDQYHKWSLESLKTIRAPIITCEAVLAEAWHLLGAAPPARTTLSKLYKQGVFKVELEFARQSESIWDLLLKYQDIPMDLADACVVRLSEIFPKYSVWTVDSDFKFYRRNKRKIIPLLAPWQDER